MTAIKERDEKLVKALKETKKLYRLAITMDDFQKQRFILEYIKGLTLKHSEYLCVFKVCSEVLQAYPERMPHDNTLLEEAMDRLEQPYKSIFPQSGFEEDTLIYRLFEPLIKEVHHAIPLEEFDRYEKFVIEKLFSGVYKTLIDNPNLKGDNPYYKRNYYQMRQAKKTWLKLLDEDFNNYIDYFQEEVAV